MRTVVRTAVQFVDQRAEPRREIFLKGNVKVNGALVARCTIRNISSMGALLTFAGGVQLPDTFTLIIPEHLFETTCGVRHRALDSIGVMFTSGRREALALFGSPWQSQR